MGQPITTIPPRRDPREALYRKLEGAPREHVEALLDAYSILQLLHDKGILELVKGMLMAGEKVLGELTQTIETEEAISLFRNLCILVKILGGLNPELLEDVEAALSHGVDPARAKKTPGLFRLFGRLSGRGSRRFLGLAASVMEAVGAHLDQAKEPGLRGEKRKMTTRRSVSLVRDNPRA